MRTDHRARAWAKKTRGGSCPDSACFAIENFENRAIAATTDEYSALAALRYVLDYRIVSLALGFDAGLTLTRQSFEGVGPAPTRWATRPLGRRPSPHQCLSVVILPRSKDSPSFSSCAFRSPR